MNKGVYSRGGRTRERKKIFRKIFLIDAIESALVSAYKKNYGNSPNVRVNIDRVNGDIDVYMRKKCGVG